MPNRTRILVIDDDPMFRNLVVSLLRKDYLVSVAASGEEGYEKAKEHRPDIAVIDIQMPGWSGLETLAAFRRDPAFKDTKTVILTGDASKDTVIAAIQAGANDYVIKTSFSREEFIQKLDRLMPTEVVPQPQVPVMATAGKAQQPVDDVSQDWDEQQSSGNDEPAQKTDIQEIMDDWD